MGQSRQKQTHRPKTHHTHGVVHLASFVLQQLRELQTTRAALEQRACSYLEAQLSQRDKPSFKPRQTLPGEQTLPSEESQEAVTCWTFP